MAAAAAERRAVTFAASPLPHVVIEHGDTRATVYALGATVASASVAGVEHLYMSPSARYDGATPLRGGIPVCWPLFGPPPAEGACAALPQHGFARRTPWAFVAHTYCTADAEADDGQQQQHTFVTLELHDSEATRAVWPHRFVARYTVRVAAGGTLRTQLHVTNSGDDGPLRFTTALHTYVRVDDHAAARVHGLRGVRYRDKVRDHAEAVEDAEQLALDGEVDRVYLGAFAAAHDRPLRVTAPQRVVELRTTPAAALPDAVVWNPGAAVAARIGDLDDDGYRHFVCVEAGAVAKPVSVAPGQSWRAEQCMLMKNV